MASSISARSRRHPLGRFLKVGGKRLTTSSTIVQGFSTVSTNSACGSLPSAVMTASRWRHLLFTLPFTSLLPSRVPSLLRRLAVSLPGLPASARTHSERRYCVPSCTPMPQNPVLRTPPPGASMRTLSACFCTSLSMPSRQSSNWLCSGSQPFGSLSENSSERLRISSA